MCPDRRRTEPRCSISPYEALSGRAFAKAIERRGWRLLRVNGSHHIYGREGVAARLSVPIHGNALLKAGLQRHLIKLAGLTDDDLA